MRAEAVAAAISAHDGWRADVVAGMSAIGGGSAPGVELPTWLVSIAKDGLTPDAIEAQLRRLLHRSSRASSATGCCWIFEPCLQIKIHCSLD